MKLLKTQTVPVAIDQWNQRRQKDSEGQFYRKIAAQGPRSDFENGTTQGLYLAAADGTFLGYTNHRGPDRVMQFLKAGLAKHRPTDAAKVSVKTQDRRFTYQPPNGGLVIRVQAKVLDGYETPRNNFEKIFQSAVSRDNLWLTKTEHAQLVAGQFPAGAAIRLVRYHLVDNTRGEPPAWSREEIVSQKVSLTDGVVSGNVRLRTADGSRTYTAELLGEIQVEKNRVVKFDVVALGTFSGEGRYTGGAPKGKFPLAVSFTLADGTDLADNVPPQHARGWVEDYLR